MVAAPHSPRLIKILHLIFPFRRLALGDQGRSVRLGTSLRRGGWGAREALVPGGLAGGAGRGAPAAEANGTLVRVMSEAAGAGRRQDPLSRAGVPTALSPRAAPGLRLIPRVEDECDRAVVDEVDVHVRLEDAGRNEAHHRFVYRLRRKTEREWPHDRIIEAHGLIMGDRPGRPFARGCWGFP